MGLRFSRSFKLFPGVRINLSKRGVSTSFGVKGATLNFSSRGVRGTVGLPGTGLSYSKQLTGGSKRKAPEPEDFNYWRPPGAGGPSGAPSLPSPQVGRAVASKALGDLTSPALKDFKQMLQDVESQRRKVLAEIDELRRQLVRWEKEEKWKGGVLKGLFRRRLQELASLLPETRRDLNELSDWLANSVVCIEYDGDPRLSTAYAKLEQSFLACSKSPLIWDVTTERDTNRARERTTASRSIQRFPVSLRLEDPEILKFSGRALALGNSNGEDLLIIPGMIVLGRKSGEFALVELDSLEVTCEEVQFVETEQVPPGAQVAGHTWFKANKDGSPDKRFANNFQIPICLYGRIVLRTVEGLHEEYLFSDRGAAMAFGRSLQEYGQLMREG